MSQLRLGFGLVAAGSALSVVAGALRLTGENVRTYEGACWQWEGCGNYAGGGSGVAHLIVPVALTLLALGYATVALTPRRIGPTLEKGFGTLAVGLLMLVGASNLPIPPGTNPAQSLELVLLYALGFLASIVGFGAVGASIDRAPRPLRLAFLALPLGGVSIVAPWLPVLVLVCLAAYRTRRNGQGRSEHSG